MSEPRLINTPLAHYESAYERVEGEYVPSKSLLGFLSICQKRWGEDFFAGHWLELGCGRGLTFDGLESGFPCDVLGCDFSAKACQDAQSNTKVNSAISRQFHRAQLQSPWPSDWPCFDGILDSHLLHCLSGRDEIHSCLRQAYDHLAPGSKLLAEVMISSNTFVADLGLQFDAQTGILKREGGPTLHTVLAAYDWEQLLLSAGLQIFYFEVYSHLRFIHNPKRSHLLESDPELLRFIAIKPKE